MLQGSLQTEEGTDAEAQDRDDIPNRSQRQGQPDLRCHTKLQLLKLDPPNQKMTAQLSLEYRAKLTILQLEDFSQTHNKPTSFVVVGRHYLLQLVSLYVSCLDLTP